MIPGSPPGSGNLNERDLERLELSLYILSLQFFFDLTKWENDFPAKICAQDCWKEKSELNEEQTHQAF